VPTHEPTEPTIKEKPAMPTMIIDDVEVEVGRKENVIQAARKAGVEIPHYCWHPDLSVVASCRMCLVEVGDRRPDGSVVMGPKLVPACQTPTKPDMVVRTQTTKVQQSQATTLEYLLLNHPLDCSICDQAGECYLQDYTYKFGKAHSRLQEPKIQRLDKYHIGDQIALFTDRCVMCTRCVRFTREIAGTAELQVIHRGSGEEIDVFPGHPCNNKLAGNVVDICPVGALCSKDFLYKKRVWWLKSQESVCTGCSTGCSIHVDQNEDKVYRLRPRENPSAQGSFMCDDGRFGFHYIHDPNRLQAPRLGRSSTNDPHPGEGASPFVDPWPAVLEGARRVFAQPNQRTLAVFSPFMTCEEAYLLASWMKSLPGPATLVLGPVPIDGVDDHYPKGPGGQSPPPRQAKFTIRAEKAPNRMGVSAILRHFQGEVLEWSAIEPDVHADRFDRAYIVGGGGPGYLDRLNTTAIDHLRTIVVQDILPSPWSERADILLASGSFAEREGSLVNHASLAQQIKPAVRPPGEARPDGRLLMMLAGRPGLYHAASLRDEMAEEIGFFAAWKGMSLEPHGILLEKRPLTATVVDVAKSTGPLGPAGSAKGASPQ
jgi:NADH-quinone oxidoreductase subunit G